MKATEAGKAAATSAAATQQKCGEAKKRKGAPKSAPTGDKKGKKKEMESEDELEASEDGKEDGEEDGEPEECAPPLRPVRRSQ
jgi:hypothetical protein